jgi:hypothetical protein
MVRPLTRTNPGITPYSPSPPMFGNWDGGPKRGSQPRPNGYENWSIMEALRNLFSPLPLMASE